MVLLGADPRLVPRAFALARRTYRTIAQNLFWAFAYNAAALPVAEQAAPTSPDPAPDTPAAADPSDAPPAAATPPAPPAGAGPEKPAASIDGTTAQAADTSIRVDTAKLDFLVDAVGELVIAQTMALPRAFR